MMLTKPHNHKPLFLENFRLYGSSYIYMESQLKILLPTLWMLPHDTRRLLFKKFFNKEYWRVLGARQDLEKSFTHDENHKLVYSINQFHEKKCIFVHIPKCGGISLAQSLLGHCIPHSTITDYQIMFGADIFNNYFKFTIVRNPWDRLVSAYFFLKEGGFDSTDKAIFASIIEKNPTFSGFVEFLYSHREYMQWTHFIPQSRWIKTPSGQVPLDRIGRLENLNESLKEIGPNIGLTHIPVIKKTNTSTRDSDFRSYYSNKTKNMAAELYKEDIELLGYNFEG